MTKTKYIPSGLKAQESIYVVPVGNVVGLDNLVNVSPLRLYIKIR
jgi:hypothetical protein